MRLSVIGLGKLGAPLAAVMASKGYDVIGTDINPDAVDMINAGCAPVEETDLQEFIDKSGNRLSATLDTEAAVLGSDFSFVIVPTPSEPDGTFSMQYAVAAAERIGAALAKKDHFHIVVLTSTVMPGDTETVFIPALEHSSGKQCGRDFGVCYNPEFIALGSVIADMLKPDLILIGESDERSGAALARIYEDSCENSPTIARMNFVNAELTKISVNTFVTTKISYANMLSQVCECLPGADANVVTRAIGLDSRIGRKYLSAAVSYGGPCFPRDNKAFSAMARSLGVDPAIAEATDRVNALQIETLLQRSMRLCPKGGRIAVLGLSYKPDTGVVEVSAGIEVANALAQQGYLVSAYDPQAMENGRPLLADNVELAPSLEACVDNTDVILIMTAWQEFKRLPVCKFGTGSMRPVVIDCWHLFKPDELAGHADVLYVGVLGAREHYEPAAVAAAE